MAVKNSRKRSLLIYSYFKKTVQLQRLKGMESSKLGKAKGHHYSIEAIRKECVSEVME